MNASKDYLRQIEMLSSCLNGEMLSKADYAIRYKVEEITINRDIQALRKNGIQIHSKKNCVSLLEYPPREILIKLCADYLPLKLNSTIFTKQIALFANQKKETFFQNLILITKAVSEKTGLLITYKNKTGDELAYSINPIRLVLKDKNWLLFAQKDGEEEIKTFYLSRILSLKPVHKRVNSISARSKTKLIEMIFEFDSSVVNEVLDKIWFDEYEIDQRDDGKLILKTKQQINSSLAAWCISWWDTMKIIEPLELKKFCSEMIGDFQRINY